MLSATENTRRFFHANISKTSKISFLFFLAFFLMDRQIPKVWYTVRSLLSKQSCLDLSVDLLKNFIYLKGDWSIFIKINVLYNIKIIVSF